MQTTDDQTKAAGSSGGFFTVSINSIDRMVAAGAGSPQVMAYLVLARGAGKHSYSSWGAGACAKYTELTYHKAAQAVAWLEAKGFISRVAAPIGRETALPKWELNLLPDDVEVALANDLIGGIGKGKQNPPMKRIGELPMGRHGGMRAAELDALMVLLHLYRHQNIADYGGIDPSSGIYRRWTAAKNESGKEVVNIEGTTAALYEIRGGDETVFLKFSEEALFYVDDAEERSERFWDAFNNLKRLEWLYETTQVWTGDPSKDREAEPLYTLYVHDRHQRKHDPYLSTDIHKAAFRAGTIDRYETFASNDDGAFNSGQFRYIANRKAGGYPIGIYRLKYRPHTRDTGKGMAAELKRVDYWRNMLSKAVPKAAPETPF